MNVCRTGPVSITYANQLGPNDYLNEATLNALMADVAAQARGKHRAYHSTVSIDTYRHTVWMKPLAAVHLSHQNYSKHSIRPSLAPFPRSSFPYRKTFRITTISLNCNDSLSKLGSVVLMAKSASFKVP